MDSLGATGNSSGGGPGKQTGSPAGNQNSVFNISYLVPIKFSRKAAPLIHYMHRYITKVTILSDLLTLIFKFLYIKLKCF